MDLPFKKQSEAGIDFYSIVWNAKGLWKYWFKTHIYTYIQPCIFQFPLTELGIFSLPNNSAFLRVLSRQVSLIQNPPNSTLVSWRTAETGVTSSALFFLPSSSSFSSSAFFSGVTVVIKLVWEMPFVVAYWPVPTSAADTESFMYISWFSFTDAKSKYLKRESLK